MRDLGVCLLLLSAGVGCGPKRFDGWLAPWNAAKNQEIVQRPLEADVGVARPKIEIAAGAEGFASIQEAFATSLQRALVQYATDKRVFRTCAAGEVQGGYRISTQIRVLQWDGNRLVGEADWTLISPAGAVVVERQQALEQTLEPGYAFEDYFAYHNFLGRAAGELAAGSSPAEAPRLPAAKERSVVAVFDVQDASGLLAADTREQLTEYLSVKLAESSSLRVVPRSQLRERLGNEKAASYKACFDESCQIDVGKSLAASKSVATKLLKVGDQCVLTSTLFDLKTETTDKAASATTACATNAMLAGIDEIARKLLD